MKNNEELLRLIDAVNVVIVALCIFILFVWINHIFQNTYVKRKFEKLSDYIKQKEKERNEQP